MNVLERQSANNSQEQDLFTHTGQVCDHIRPNYNSTRYNITSF